MRRAQAGVVLSSRLKSLMDELGTGPVLYGCMRLGCASRGEGSGDDDRQGAYAALDAAYECGARLFDHADIYSGGRSETIFGEWLASRKIARRDIIIQSKCGIRPGEGESPDRYDLSREHLLNAVEGSLRRLGVSCLDVLLLHRPDPLGAPEEVAGAVQELRRRGSIQAFGVSNFSAPQIRLYQRSLDEPIRVNQVELSLCHPGLIEAGVQVNRAAATAQAGVSGLLDWCSEQGVDVQAWSPLFAGRSGDDELSGTLRDIAQRLGVEPGTIAIAWLLRHPARVRPIVGSLRPANIRAAFAASQVELSREDWYRLFNAARGSELP